MLLTVSSEIPIFRSIYGLISSVKTFLLFPFYYLDSSNRFLNCSIEECVFQVLGFVAVFGCFFLLVYF